MPYRDIAHAAALANRGGGSLVVSLISHDPVVATAMVQAAGPWHGRDYINDRDRMGASRAMARP
jgi:oxepin-CoA hydrolase/3-oxo-5,6-dehydrosuberyl-CoA semialdehyde dehydrogenase